MDTLKVGQEQPCSLTKDVFKDYNKSNKYYILKVDGY